MKFKRFFDVLLILIFASAQACALSGKSDAIDSGDSSSENPDGSEDEFNFTSGSTTTVDNPGDSGIIPIVVDPLLFIVEVVDFSPGEYAGHGQDYMPDNVLGPPHGRGDAVQQSSEDEVLSLGHGGSITVRLGVTIIDGAGPDFTVFENAIYFGGSVESTAIETAFVEVSEDGVAWVRYPNDYNPLGNDSYSYADPANFSGFAGVTPVYADPDQGIDPLDPSVSGGDSFDLADVGLSRVSYVRLIDTGHAVLAPGTESVDDDGDPIDDAGNHFTPSVDREGFDLDAIGVLNAEQ